MTAVSNEEKIKVDAERLANMLRLSVELTTLPGVLELLVGSQLRSFLERHGTEIGIEIQPASTKDLSRR